MSQIILSKLLKTFHQLVWTFLEQLFRKYFIKDYVAVTLYLFLELRSNPLYCSSLFIIKCHINPSNNVNVFSFREKYWHWSVWVSMGASQMTPSYQCGPVPDLASWNLSDSLLLLLLSTDSSQILMWSVSCVRRCFIIQNNIRSSSSISSQITTLWLVMSIWLLISQPTSNIGETNSELVYPANTAHWWRLQ